MLLYVPKSLLTLVTPFCPQVFYYLGELNDSLSYALGAGPLFDVSEDSDYVHTLLGKNDWHVALISSWSHHNCMWFNSNYQ